MELSFGEHLALLAYEVGVLVEQLLHQVLAPRLYGRRDQVLQLG